MTILSWDRLFSAWIRIWLLCHWKRCRRSGLYCHSRMSKRHTCQFYRSRNWTNHKCNLWKKMFAVWVDTPTLLDVEKAELDKDTLRISWKLWFGKFARHLVSRTYSLLLLPLDRRVLPFDLLKSSCWWRLIIHLTMNFSGCSRWERAGLDTPDLCMLSYLCSIMLMSWLVRFDSLLCPGRTFLVEDDFDRHTPEIR